MTPPRRPHRYSRWSAGPLSLGPRPKLAMTAVLCVPLLEGLRLLLRVAHAGLFRADDALPDPALAWYLLQAILWIAIASLVLAAVWARHPMDRARDAGGRAQSGM